MNCLLLYDSLSHRFPNSCLRSGSVPIVIYLTQLRQMDWGRVHATLVIGLSASVNILNVNAIVGHNVAAIFQMRNWTDRLPLVSFLGRSYCWLSTQRFHHVHLLLIWFVFRRLFWLYVRDRNLALSSIQLLVLSITKVSTNVQVE